MRPVSPPSRARSPGGRAAASFSLGNSDKRKITRLRRDLSSWAADNGRKFRWRRDEAGDYEKIVVEVLLQRTTAAAVARFFDHFMARYPGWQALAEASEDELETLLKPLGLWRRRARSLGGLARYAAARGGDFPGDPLLHAEIPAIGQYVSNAVLMFQHGQRRPLLDTNMARVLERVVRPRRLADIRHDPWLQAAAAWLVDSPRPLRVNWAVLDFAAVICKPRKPLCCSCPARSYCAFYLEAQALAGT